MKTVDVKNVGSAPLQVTNVHTTQAAFAANATVFTLAPGATKTIQVTFTPSGVQNFAGSLTMAARIYDRRRLRGLGL